ncbi:MAG: methyltransferase [Akkermansiaceae bacterium]|nr:methyltransferase [Akkermansiaceae bacterium]
MRIIAGKAGRIAIKVPAAVARPTTDFVRQALFSIINERVENARILDLFAGSGALGLEALSRGAKACTFVDEHRQATSVITENLTKSTSQWWSCGEIRGSHFSQA